MMIQNLLVERGHMPAYPVRIYGRILWWSGAARIHEDGGGWSIVFRYWHPITWVLFITMVPVCAVLGERIFLVIPMRVGPYFQEHPEKLIWWTPFSNRQ